MWSARCGARRPAGASPGSCREAGVRRRRDERLEVAERLPRDRPQRADVLAPSGATMRACGPADLEGGQRRHRPDDDQRGGRGPRLRPPRDRRGDHRAARQDPPRHAPRDAGDVQVEARAALRLGEPLQAPAPAHDPGDGARGRWPPRRSTPGEGQDDGQRDLREARHHVAGEVEQMTALRDAPPARHQPSTKASSGGAKSVARTKQHPCQCETALQPHRQREVDEQHDRHQRPAQVVEHLPPPDRGDPGPAHAPVSPPASR
jgi:hypothetical protein